jgi:hypothetical protein
MWTDTDVWTDGRINNLTPLQSKRALLWRFKAVVSSTTYLGLHAKCQIFLSDFNHTLDFVDSFFFFTICLIIRFDGNLSSGSHACLRLGRRKDGHDEGSKLF